MQVLSIIDNSVNGHKALIQKRWTTKNNGRKHKASIGSYSCRSWAYQFEQTFCCLEYSIYSSHLLKTREVEAGQAIEKLAKSSCQPIINKELLSSSGRNEPKPNDDGINTCITASFDGGWQKRGSGHAYNSLSGHASLIGKETGKIMAYDVRCKQCRTCQAAERNGRSPKQHNRRKNWTGSSKAMESSMCVSMISGLQEKGVKVGTLVTDNDTTSIARVRTEVDGSVKKAMDSNHLKKTFTSKLYLISKKYKQLTNSVISHIGKCFMYAIKQNSNNPAQIQTNLRAITPHLYGDHHLCDSSWCGFRTSNSYVPRNLPYKKYLNDENLKSELVRILEEYAINSKNLTDLGSSQRNESFNNIVSTRNPKNKHYSASESTCFRVASAVAETNMISSYVTEVNKELFLSPGGNTKISCQASNKKRKAKSELQQTAQYKRLRRHAKDFKKKEHLGKEIREGVTYKTDIGFCKTNLKDIQHIPQPVHEPILERVKPGDYEEIIFDLETTGLGLSAIVQLSASSTSGKTFNCYVYPTENMTAEASRITGLSLHNGKVFKNGVELKSNTLEECLQEFIQWLQTFKNSVILVAHNSNFDSSILINSCQQVQIQNISNFVVGFLDTLALFRNTYQNMKNYKLGTLLENILNISFKAHDAVEDWKYLCLLYKHTKTVHNLQLADILNFTVSPDYTIKKLQHSQMTSENLNSLSDLINKTYLTKFMAKKIASSGLSFHSLNLAYDRGSKNGLKSLFSEKIKGKFRVTNCTKVIKKCNEYFCNRN